MQRPEGKGRIITDFTPVKKGAGQAVPKILAKSPAKKLPLRNRLKLRARKQKLKLARLAKPSKIPLIRFTPRTLSAGIIILTLLGLIIGNSLYQSSKYKINRTKVAFLSHSSIDTTFIKQDSKSFSYDRSAEQSAISTNDKGQKQLTVASPTDATGIDSYKATLPKNPKDGITFSDSKGTNSFNLKPLDKAVNSSLLGGRLDSGNIVYPSSNNSNEKHIYSFKKNGIKEDILLTAKPSTKELNYAYTLTLNSDQEARANPDGSIGIYIANPNNTSSNSTNPNNTASQPKDYLVYVLPKPFIIDSRGVKNYEDVFYKLEASKQTTTGNSNQTGNNGTNGQAGSTYTLTLEALNMLNKNYPLSIDPTITVTTTADFRQGLDDGMLDYTTTADQVARANVSLGTMGTATTQTAAFTTKRSSPTALAYNGYAYIFGGSFQSSLIQSSVYTDIQYCPINTNGSLGTCTTNSTGLAAAPDPWESFIYNGSIYSILGFGFGMVQRCIINSNASVSPCTFQTGISNLSKQPLFLHDNFLFTISAGDVNRCPFNSDGSIGNCTTQSAVYNSNWGVASAEIYNTWLYVTSIDVSGFMSMMICRINPDESVSNCTHSVTSLVGRSGYGLAAYRGYLYIIGGHDFFATLYDVDEAPINADGSIGSLTTLNILNTKLSLMGAFIYDGYLHVMGGNFKNGGTFFNTNDAEYVPINTGTPTFGTVSSATQQTSAFTTARYNQTSVVYDGYLYIIGGCHDAASPPCDVLLNDIQYCPINSDGSIGACTQQTNAFTTARAYHATAILNGYLYIVGGQTGALTVTNDVQYCQINNNHSVGTCTQQTNAFTTARMSHASFAYNGYLYIVGGQSFAPTSGCTPVDYCDDIQYCPINSNGSVGACTQQTSAFTTARDFLSSLTYNGYLYIVGGFSNGGALNDIQYCPINSNGSVGACTQQAAAFTTPRYNLRSVAYNGYLYIIGGQDNASIPLSDLHHCPINSNGSIGTCTQVLSAFTTARSSHTSVVYGGYLYIIGGYDNTSSYNDIQYIPTLTPTQVSHYERLINLGNGGTVTSFVINGTAKCGYTVSYKTADNTGVFGSSTTVLDVFPGVSQTVSLTGATAIAFTVVLDDSTCGGQSIVTDLSVSYTPRPSAPTLTAPLNNATAASLTPELRLGAIANTTNYLRYKIEVCSTSNCSSIVRTIDQTSSQTGWQSQSEQSGTAYTGGISSIAQYAIHKYQTPALSANTQYWWRGYAIDPSGTNTFSPASAISTFTTKQTTANVINIGGGTTIYSGTTIGN